jgi:hypothetical protein
MKITQKQFTDYILGWLSSDAANRAELTMDEMAACLHNARVMLKDDQDGIKAEIKRREINAKTS